MYSADTPMRWGALMVVVPGRDNGDGDGACGDGDASASRSVVFAPPRRAADPVPWVRLNWQTPILQTLQSTSKTLLIAFSCFPFRSHLAVHIVDPQLSEPVSILTGPVSLS
jgi:hypothetical protein